VNGTAVERLLREVAAHDGRAKAQLVREEAVRAIRMLESRLIAALGGETLRGLTNLLPGGQFYGANVRSIGEHGIDTWLPRDGSVVLVIDKMGKLVMARQNPEFAGEANWRPVDDSELRAADLTLYTEAVEDVLEAHLEKAEETGRRDSSVKLLAYRLRQALGAA